MACVQNLIRRGNCYHFRITVPAELRMLLGRREIRRSLGRIPARTAAIKALLGSHQAHSFFARLRSMTQPLPDGVVQQLAREFYDQLLALDWLERQDPQRREKIDGDLSRADLDRLSRPAVLDHLTSEFDNGDLFEVEPWVEKAIDRHGLDIRTVDGPDGLPDPRFATLVGAFAEARLEAEHRKLERDKGDFGGTPALPILRDSGAALPPGPGGPGFVAPARAPQPAPHPVPLLNETAQTVPMPAPSEIKGPGRTGGLAAERARLPAGSLLDAFWATRTDRRIRTAGDYKLSLRMFDEITGSKPIGDIDDDDVTLFIETMAKAPVKFEARFRTSSVLEAIRLNEALPASERYPAIDKKTIREKRYANLRALFAWAVRSKIIDRSPFDGRGVDLRAPPQGTSKPCDAFTIDQLNRLFGMPIFMASAGERKPLEPGNYKIRDHRFWVPLLILYGGMRPSELGGVTMADVLTVEGYPCLRLTTTPDPDDPEVDRRKKTYGSIRTIPIHPELIRIGFLEYIAAIKAQGSARLFPTWRSNKSSGYSNSIGKFINERLLPRAKLKTKSHKLYSLRHNFTGLLDQNQINDRLQCLLGGWGDLVGQARKAYKGRILTKSDIETFCRLQYEGLDLSHIHY